MHTSYCTPYSDFGWAMKTNIAKEMENGNLHMQALKSILTFNNYDACEPENMVGKNAKLLRSVLKSLRYGNGGACARQNHFQGNLLRYRRPTYSQSELSTQKLERILKNRFERLGITNQYSEKLLKTPEEKNPKPQYVDLQLELALVPRDTHFTHHPMT